MLEVTKATLTRIRSEDDYNAREILVDSDACCPSIIGLENPNDTWQDCNYKCHECWEKALAEVEDFKILWKHKGSDEYV